MRVTGTGLRASRNHDPLHPPLLTRAFVLAAMANAIVSLSGSLFVHLPGFLQQIGAGEGEVGRIMAMQAIGAILVWPLVGTVMDTRGRRVVILGGVALFVVAIGLYLSVSTLGPRIYAVRLIDGAAGTMWYTALFTYAADLVPERRRAEGLAIFGVSGLIPLGLGAFSGDVILAHAGFREMFIGALALAVLDSPCVYLCGMFRPYAPSRLSDPVASCGPPQREICCRSGLRHSRSSWVWWSCSHSSRPSSRQPVSAAWAAFLVRMPRRLSCSGCSWGGFRIDWGLGAWSASRCRATRVGSSCWRWQTHRHMCWLRDFC
jgi:MFS family permease